MELRRIPRFLIKKLESSVNFLTSEISNLVDAAVIILILGIYYELAMTLEPNNSLHFFVLGLIAVVWMFRDSYRDQSLDELEASKEGFRVSFTDIKDNFQTGKEGDEIE